MKGRNKYASSPRDAIGVNGVLEGYVRKFEKFGMYWLNRAGHMAPVNMHRFELSYKKIILILFHSVITPE